MKRLLTILGCITLAGTVYGAGGGQTSLTVSSGTYQPISTYVNDDGANRQAIIIGARTSSATLTVDNVTGIPVFLSTGSSNGVVTNGVGTVNVISTNTLNVSASQSGNWTTNGVGTVNVVSTNTLNVSASQSGNWTTNGVGTVNVVSTNTLTTSISGTPSVNLSQVGGNTVSQAASGEQKISCQIAGDSNTVSGSFSATTVSNSTGAINSTVMPAAFTLVGGIGPSSNIQTFRVDASSQLLVSGSFSSTSVSNSTAPLNSSLLPAALTVIGGIGPGNIAQSFSVDASSNVKVVIQNPTTNIVSTGTLSVTAIPSQATITVTPGTGTYTTSGTALQNTATVTPGTGTFAVGGNVANAASDSGNPVKIGGIGRTTYQTAVTDGQRVDAQFDSEGKQVMMPYAVPALSTSGVTAAMTGTTDTVLISSGGASINTYIDQIICTNSHATVGTVINIKNGQTVRYTAYAVAAGGGFSITLPTPLAGASNTQWAAVNATTGSNTYCSVSGYFAKN